MDQSLKELTQTTKPTATEGLFTPMVTCMMATGKMTKQMAMELTIIWTAQLTREIGYWTNKVVKVMKLGQTEPFIKADIRMARSLERVSLNGLMVALTMEDSTKIPFKEWVSTRGPTEDFTSGNGMRM